MMEAKALSFFGLNKTPLISLKGYLGHTLGASGVIEIAICLQIIRNNLIFGMISMAFPICW